MTTHEPSRSSDADPVHLPVLVEEVVALIAPRQDGCYVDGTLGLGGHTAALLEAGAGRVIALDRDEDAIAVARERLGARSSRVTFVHEDYRQLPAVLAREGVAGVDGIVVDLGVSSMQLDTASRGFSFRQAGPLDMRMDRSKGATLQDRIAATDETTLADVIWRFGEERRARRVARAVVEAQDRGELTDTLALASVVRRAAGSGSWERIDPATRTFQALRIWVNGELDGLDTFVEDAAGRLRKDGRLAVLAFHSLEDRVVKHTMRRLATPATEYRLVQRRAIVASDAERATNPRARSARLRGLVRVA